MSLYRERFEELKHSGNLPSPAGVGLRILVITQSDDCSMQEIVDVIQTDPALTGRLIRLASSAKAESVVPISTVNEAAMRLGSKSVCHLALGFSLVAGNRSGRCKAFDYELFWSFSLATAVAAQRIAAKFSLADPAEAFTLGLLTNIGKLALASVHPEEYEDVHRMLDQDPSRELAEVEREHLYIDHAAVTSALLEDWGLPPTFSEAAYHADATEFPTNFSEPGAEGLLKVIRAAIVMADVCTTDFERQLLLWPATQGICDVLGISTGDMCEVFDAVVPAWEEWGKQLDVRTNPVRASSEFIRLEREEREEITADPSDGQRLRILAVDDDPVSLRLLVSLLRRSGHDVLTAEDGRQALEVYLEQGAQVVITDWMMPEMDGLLLCQQLRRTEEGRKLYILILTGRTEEERIVEAFQAGVDDYIVKPFKPELLSARIQPAIRVILLQSEHDRQVREKERLNRQLDIEKRKFKMAAMTDSLTDLPNRRYAMKRLEKEWANANRAGSGFSVIMLDIDHFKRVNDEWGHDVGDVVLRATARKIQSVLRRGDTCARMGGEEFLVICSNTDSDEGVLKVAERIRVAVEENVVQSGGFDRNVTVSLGAAVLSSEVHSIDALLKIADEAVYRSKDAGRNQVHLGRPSPPDRKSA